MKKIRINNDIDISLTVSRDGMVEDFNGKDIGLSLVVRNEVIPVTQYTIEGNIISFRFPALEQTRLGAYSLTLQVKEGENINTVDKCDAFELVKSSCQIGGQDEPNIRTESVELSVNVNFNSGEGGGTTDYTALANKPRINNIELVGNISLDKIGAQTKGDYVTPDILNESVKVITDRFDKLVGGNTTTAIDNFKEMEAFLAGITDTQTLTGLLAEQRASLMNLIPTKNSQLTNDSGYATSAEVTLQINAAISGLTGQINEIASLIGTEGGTV